MQRFSWCAASLALLALSSTSCVSRAQYDRLVTEYHAENTARNLAEGSLADLESSVDEALRRAEEAERRASQSGRSSQQAIDRLQRELAAAQAAQKHVQSSLGTLEGVVVLPTEGGFRILVDDAILFDSGSTVIKTPGKLALNEIAREIVSQGYDEVRIDGHTDDQPLRKRAPDYRYGNHELAADRAFSVFGYLTDAGGVSSDVLSVAAFGPNRPLAKGADDTSRQRNRRVEILVHVGAQPPEGSRRPIGDYPRLDSERLLLYFAMQSLEQRRPHDSDADSELLRRSGRLPDAVLRGPSVPGTSFERESAPRPPSRRLPPRIHGGVSASGRSEIR